MYNFAMLQSEEEYTRYCRWWRDSLLIRVHFSIKVLIVPYLVTWFVVANTAHALWRTSQNVISWLVEKERIICWSLITVNKFSLYSLSVCLLRQSYSWIIQSLMVRLVVGSLMLHKASLSLCNHTETENSKGMLSLQITGSRWRTSRREKDGVGGLTATRGMSSTCGKRWCNQNRRATRAKEKK